MPRSIRRFVQIQLTWCAILALTTQPATAQFLCGSGSQGCGGTIVSASSWGSPCGTMSAGWGTGFVTSGCPTGHVVYYGGYDGSCSAASCCGYAGWDCVVGFATDSCCVASAGCGLCDTTMSCVTESYCGSVDCGDVCGGCGIISQGAVVEGGGAGCIGCQSGVIVDQPVITDIPTVVEDSGTSIVAPVAPLERADTGMDLPPTPPDAATDMPPFEEPSVAPLADDGPEAFGEPAGDMPAEEPADEMDDLFGGPGTEPAGGIEDVAPPADTLPPAADEGLQPAAPAEEENLGEELDDLFGQSRPGAKLPVKTWVDDTGHFRTSAELAQIGDSYVRLLKQNGRFCTVPFGRLSDSDFAYVQRQASKMGRAPLVRVANR